MINFKKIFAAAAAAMMILILMCSCADSSDTQYEHLKTDIVGIWMDEDGPTVDSNNPFGKSLKFYEFTSDGYVYYHYIFVNSETNIPSDGTIGGSSYYFDGNMLVNVSGSEEEGTAEKTGALIEINGTSMTMSNNSGATNYTKLSVEEATGYYIYYKDEALYEKQQELINGYSEDESYTDSTELTDEMTESEDTEEITESVSETAE